VVLNLAFSFFITSPSLADDWNNFNRLMDKYYFLDDQPVTEITCHVSVSSLNNIRTQLKPIEEKVEVDEDINTFSVTYKKGEGITTSKPHFMVSLKTTEDVANPEQVKRGVETINIGAADQISGVIDVIEGQLDELIRPKKEKISDLKVKASKGTTTVEYTKDKKQFREVYLGDSRKVFIKDPNNSMVIKSSDTFTLIAGKRALSKSDMKLTLGDMATTMKMAILYKQVGTVSFPSLLDQQAHIENPSFKADANFSINLDQCVSK